MKLANGALKMLRIALIIFGAILLPAQAQAATLSYAEYYIDNGTPTSISPCDGVFDEAEEEFCLDNIPVPDLAVGWHTLFLRLKDTNNVWGMRQHRFYYSSSSPYVTTTITNAQYSIDGAAWQNLPTTDGSYNEPFEILQLAGISSENLSLGDHQLFVKVCDSYSAWSTVRKLNFKVIDASPYKHIAAAEYFIDADPGQGQAIALLPTDSSYNEPIEEAYKNDIPTANLSTGNHMVYVRFKDNWSRWPLNHNGWGPILSCSLRVLPDSLPQVTLTYPPDSSIIGCNDTIDLSWICTDTLPIYRHRLDYKIVTDTAWQTISDWADSCGGHYSWVVPAVEQTIWLKITIENSINNIGCDSVYLAIRDVPPAPVLISPPNDTIIFEPNPVLLLWHSIADADSFRLNLCKDSSFAESLIISFTCDPNDTSHDVTDTLTCATWFWRVGAFNEIGQSQWSEVWRFIYDDTTDVYDNSTQIPISFFLSQNSPNPFNARTTIKYGLPRPSHVTVNIYDLLGRKVANLIDEYQPAGFHQAIWDANGKTSSMYFYTINTENFTEVKKMILLK